MKYWIWAGAGKVRSGEIYSRASQWGSRPRVRCRMSELVVVLNGFSDPWAISTDVGIDSWLLFGSTGDVTPRYKASETVSTHQRTPRIALWERGRESYTETQGEKDRETEGDTETLEKERETCRDGEKYSGTEREADRERGRQTDAKSDRILERD